MCKDTTERDSILWKRNYDRDAHDAVQHRQIFAQYIVHRGAKVSPSRSPMASKFQNRADDSLPISIVDSSINFQLSI